MTVYSVDIFCQCIGYVCAKNDDEARIKATNLLGFNNFNEYISCYPGKFELNSEIRKLVKNTPAYEYFEETNRDIDNYSFILDIGDTCGLSCADDFRTDARDILKRYYDPRLSITLLVPKMDELKQCFYSDDEPVDGWDDEIMWYCEDWTEET